MEVEVIDDDEYALLEAACLQAEKNINQSSHETNPKRPRFLPTCLASVPPAPAVPSLIYRGKTTYCREVAQIDRAAAFLLAIEKPVGFDVEWTVTYETGKTPRPIALMQLCVVDPSVYTPDGKPHYHCFLLHINRRSKIIDKNETPDDGPPAPILPPKLIEFLASETVLKAGVGIHGDSLKLERDYNIKMKGLIDLSDAANARLCSSSTGAETTTAAAATAVQMPQKWSMVALAEKLMCATVKKSQNLRCSDWEQDPLKAEQQKYAATDAWVSLRLYEILSSMPIMWQPAVPAIPANSNTSIINNLILHRKEYIPACKEPAALQPAKLAVLQQHYQGVEVVEIAAQRNIQPSTVQSYLAEAIIAGYAYNWGTLCISNEIIFLAEKVALEAGVVPASVPAPDSRLENKNVLSKNAKEMNFGHDYTPRDVLNEVLETRNIKIRNLFEEMERKIPGMGFGDLRLAFAHLGRKNGLSNIDKFDYM